MLFSPNLPRVINCLRLGYVRGIRELIGVALYVSQRNVSLNPFSYLLCKVPYVHWNILPNPRICS